MILASQQIYTDLFGKISDVVKTNNIKKWLVKGHYVNTTILNQKSDSSGGPVSILFQ